MEGFVVVDNHTGFSYDNVELSFAIFELPHIPYGAGEGRPPPIPVPPESTISELRGEMMGELNRLQSIQKAPMKRTQRFKKLL